MKYLTFLFFFSISSVFASDITDAIKRTLELQKSNELLEELKPNLLRIEYFLQSPHVKNHKTIIMTEFINYSLKNPINKEFNRYPFQEYSIKSEIDIIEDKLNKMSPTSKLLASRIIIEMKFLLQQKDFVKYLKRIKKSYYFTSKNLKLIDKKMRYLEPWYNFFLQSSIKDINNLSLKHTKEFISHFGKSVEFLLNSKINISPDQKLVTFSSATSWTKSQTIEEKLDMLINETSEKEKTLEQASLDNDPTNSSKVWAPKNIEMTKLEKFINLNNLKNYPKPSPNYIAPSELPIPMNDW